MKTNELTGAALDWAVAKCLGYPDGFPQALLGKRPKGFGWANVEWQPSSDWSQGGPIIERERIELLPMFNPDYYSARVAIGGKWCKGDTPLIAAMRCYVSSKLGDDIDLPENLS